VYPLQGRCIGLTILPSSYADCLEMWQSEPSVTLRACNRPVQGLLCLFLLELHETCNVQVMVCIVDP
jgi:hypothetical protein